MSPGGPSPSLAPGSALVIGKVTHRRHRPRDHRLALRTYHVLLDVDELPRLDREIPGFGYRRAALTSFQDSDHFGPADLPVRAKLARWLQEQGHELPDGRLQVLTNLRILGHVFNPVSWWFCHDRQGALRLIVAEVNNTFGDAHAYVLDDLQHRLGVVHARATKVFHVSPFLPIEGLTYDFSFVLRDGRITVKMDVDDAQGRLLDATQDGERRSLRGLPMALVTHPLMTLRTVAAIHLEALKLWRKRVPFFRRPAPPADGYLARAGSPPRPSQPRTSPARAAHRAHPPRSLAS